MVGITLSMLAMALATGATAVLAQSAAQSSPSEASRMAYGKHLASECSACHRLDGMDNGIPSILGWPVAAFVETMGYYKSGARPNQVMVSVAKSLDDEQLQALALYYGSLPKRSKGK